MQFSPELRDGVADGSITVSYRLWSRPKVKVGGVYGSAEARIEVDDIELVPFSSITSADLARTGEADLERLRRRAAHAGPIHDDTLLYRIESTSGDHRTTSTGDCGAAAAVRGSGPAGRRWGERSGSSRLGALAVRRIRPGGSSSGWPRRRSPPCEMTPPP